jgi:hypothetical protein
MVVVPGPDSAEHHEHEAERRDHLGHQRAVIVALVGGDADRVEFEHQVRDDRAAQPAGELNAAEGGGLTGA